MKDHVIAALRQIEDSAASNIWDAHQGCAAIAGALLCTEDLVDLNSRSALEHLVRQFAPLDNISLATAERKRPPLTFEIFAAKLLAEVAVAAEEPKEIGHDVIYAAYVLKALDSFKITPWESLLTHITGLVRKIKAAGPGWITINGENQLRALHEMDESTGSDYWSEFAAFDRPLQMEIGDMQLGHLLTHGHAITVLDRFGPAALSHDLNIAFRKRLQGLRIANGEQRDRSPLPVRKMDPREKAYWSAASEHGDMHGHVLKYAYSFLELRKERIRPLDMEAFGRIVWPDKNSVWTTP